jgi:hypothetical protein
MLLILLAISRPPGAVLEALELCLDLVFLAFLAVKNKP